MRRSPSKIILFGKLLIAVELVSANALAEELPHHLVVVGDSISACKMQTPPGDCWPTIVRQQRSVQVHNLAANAARAGQWRDESFSPLHVVPGDCWAFIGLGINDLFAGASVAETLGAEATVIANLMSAGTTRVVILIMPTFGLVPLETLGELERLYCALVPNVDCIDLRAMAEGERRVRFFPPGDVHPNRRGQRWIARRVVEWLDDVVRPEGRVATR